jgi:hypothetical protein
MSQLKNPLEVYKLLPQTNCGQCFLPTCLAFSAAVIKGDKKLSHCPHLEPGLGETFADKVAPRPTSDQQREKHLALLKENIRGMDLPAAAQRLGARTIGDRLAVRCLGKDFLVDPAGNVTSECHTHAGLTIPLLSYIINSTGANASGKWVPFRELKNGAPMSALFGQRGEKPLQQLADSQTDIFEIIISLFSGRTAKTPFAADISLVLYPLPKVPVLICYWKPEEDLDSKLNIFFDATAENHLAIESIYSLGVGLVTMFERITQRHC